MLQGVHDSICSSFRRWKRERAVEGGGVRWGGGDVHVACGLFCSFRVGQVFRV